MVAEVNEKKCIMMMCSADHDTGDGNRNISNQLHSSMFLFFDTNKSRQLQVSTGLVFNNNGKDPIAIAALSLVFFLLDSQARSVTSKKSH